MAQQCSMLFGQMVHLAHLLDNPPAAIVLAFSQHSFQLFIYASLRPKWPEMVVMQSIIIFSYTIVFLKCKHLYIAIIAILRRRTEFITNCY